MSEISTVALDGYCELPESAMRQRGADFLAEMRRRRSVRDFADRPLPPGLIEDCVAAAATAPSGANLQPWHFVIVRSAATKRRIRELAEREERAFYGGRASQQWLRDLAPLGTSATKPFLETAPCLIVLFVELTRRTPDGAVRRHYYPLQSAAIAAGMLITAIHHAGLVCLPYTPCRMGFLNPILGRPRNERPLMIVVTGYPAPGARVPALTRKPWDQVVSYA